MKVRTLIITLELQTDMPVKELNCYIKDSLSWEPETAEGFTVNVQQVKTQVTQAPKLIKKK